MEIYTIGFTKTSAEQFFGSLRRAGIERLIDVRLNNRSQLAGFSKRDDLAYFLRELCNAEYRHDVRLAPTAEMLKAYRDREMTWDEYEGEFQRLMAERRIETWLAPEEFDTSTALLCSEATAEHCHRRLVAEYLGQRWQDVRINHL